METFGNNLLVTAAQKQSFEQTGISFTGTSDFKGTEVLFPEERILIAKAVSKRQIEFATGRWCSRASMDKLGMAPLPILIGNNREPIWPDGVCGSISHTSDYICAALSTSLLSIGIDVQLMNQKLSGDVWAKILNEDEQEWMEKSSQTEQLKWKFVIFSAKESFYKCVYPLVRKYLGFKDVSVHLTEDAAKFKIILNRDLDYKFQIRKVFYGEFSLTPTHVLSWISLNKNADLDERFIISR